MNDLPLESPLNKFCYKMDKRLSGRSVFEYYDYVEKIDSEKLTMLLLADFDYRHVSQLNVLIEIYGQQGCGKSLFGQNLAGNIGKIYQKPFNMEENTVADFDILNDILHKSDFRTTFVVDEQPRSVFGYGANRVMYGLKDFEEICRYTMKNIVYISPTTREHSSYYVFKEDEKSSVDRFENKDCLNCHKQKDCLKIYAENKFKPLCGIPFWQRHGYPVAFNFMLCMPRKTDGSLMPRGYCRFPMLSPDLVKRYDQIKGKNIEQFESKESQGWKKQREELKEFQEIYREVLVDDNGKVASMNLIKGYLLDHFGARSFTTTELDIMCSLIKAEINNPSFVENVQKEFNAERYV